MKTDDMTEAAFAMKAWFLGRRLCLRADPPCAIRPCEQHELVARQTLRSAIASTPAAAGPPPAAQGSTVRLGVSDPPAPASSAAPTPEQPKVVSLMEALTAALDAMKSNRLGTVNPEPAEGAADTAREQV